MFGQGAGMGCLWLTEITSRAVARVTQLEERQSESRALEILTKLRKDSNASFAIVVFPTVLRVFPGGGHLIFDANPERLAKIFLEYPDDQSRFVRAYSIEPVPFDAKDVFGTTPYAEGFLIRFHRTLDDGTPLINNLKQKIRLRLPTDAGILTATLKLSDMGIEKLEDF